MDLITSRESNLNLTLRKDNDNFLLQFKTPEKQNYKNRGFSYTAPKLWNSLPYSIRSSNTMDTFKTKLKTFVYNKWLTGV